MTNWGGTIAMGSWVPDLKLLFQSYLESTLQSVFDNMSDDELRDVLIVVFVAELDQEYVARIAAQVCCPDSTPWLVQGTLKGDHKDHHLQVEQFKIKTNPKPFSFYWMMHTHSILACKRRERIRGKYHFRLTSCLTVLEMCLCAGCAEFWTARCKFLNE